MDTKTTEQEMIDLIFAEDIKGAEAVYRTLRTKGREYEIDLMWVKAFKDSGLINKGVDKKVDVVKAPPLTE